MNPLTLLFLAFSLFLGTLTTLSSEHWMLAWLGLEINTLAIIPLMIKTHHPRAIEAAIKYFLVQTSTSATLLFSCTMIAWVTGQWSIIPHTDLTAVDLLTISLAMKLGIAPFHFWLPDVLQGITLPTGLILSTWQKIPPVVLLFQVAPNTNLNLLLTMALLSTIIGGWGGINQTQIRKLMAYSSIAHLGWMVAVVKLAPELAFFNFIIYLLITTTMFWTFHILDIKTTPNILLAWSKSPGLTTLALLMLLSLAGLPPLTGFLPKLVIAQKLISSHLTPLATAMLLTTLLSLFFYLRLVYVLAITMAPHPLFSLAPWKNSCRPRPTKTLAILITLSLFLAPAYPMISVFF
uniref:NADH-ubiquinone oxidoreductase chain 2 n=1 Tax=Craugastor rhodopis TaxID=228446 RepID=Q53EB3_9NEOB|nr:NADH dehydrogenase subunit II [Craugastor rhodopis]